MAAVALVITGAPEAMVMVNVALPVPVALVALSVAVETPTAVGVPVMAPVAVLTLNPAGKRWRCSSSASRLP